MKNLSIQVDKDEYDKDKKFSPKITSPAPDLTNTQDGNIGLHLQVPRGGTHLNRVGSELTIFFFLIKSLFVAVGFVYSRWRSTVTDGCVEHPHTAHFLTHLHISSLCTCTRMAQGVARRVCIKHVHPHVITCLSVGCFLVLSSSSVSRASAFSLTSTCSLS